MSDFERNIFWSFYPVYIFSKMLGLTPFTSIKNLIGRFYIEYSKTYDAVTWLTQMVMVFSAACYLLSFPTINDLGSNILNLAFAINESVISLMIFSRAFCNRLHMGTTIKIWEELYSVDRKLFKLGVNLDYVKLKSTTLLWMAVDMFFVCFFHLECQYYQYGQI